MFRRLAIVLGSLSLASCALDLAGPEQQLPGLKVELSVEPNEVAPGDPFTAHVHLTNTTSDTIKLVTSESCLANLEILQGDERMPFRGEWLGCLTVITTHTFAPGETKTRSWELRAELHAKSTEEPTPAPKGSYVVRAKIGMDPDDMSSGRRPVVEAELRVK
jgi:hypothetical protein